MTRLALCSLVLALVGCTVQRDLNSAYCGDDLDCSDIPGTTCVRDYCISMGEVDGGDAGDGEDAPDAGDPDTGPEACTMDEVCYTGPIGTQNQGVCATGVRRCVDGFFQECEDEVTPVAEVCDGFDNDCNGTVDDAMGLVSDDDCGGCGIACDTAMGFACCSDGDGVAACRNLARDEGFCGTCSGSCGAGTECCGDGCVDVQTDRENCGECGRTCPGTQSCCGGECTDTAADADNCSVCGMGCSDPSPLCCNGTCGAIADPVCNSCDPSCTGGLECFNGRCVDPENDPTACGAGRVDCEGDDLCCGGTCTPRDATQCAACGTACGAGELCCSGTCRPSGAANCAECGRVCSGSTAEDACCPETGCVDLDLTANCGGCGIECGAGAVCANRSCCGGSDTPTERVCAGACVDTATSRAHCGGCAGAGGERCSDGGLLGIGRENCVDGTCR